MPKIQGYEDQIVAQGVLNTQANPEDFGAQVGQGVQRFGNTLGDIGERIQKNAETQDVTDQHVRVAAASAEWEENYRARMATTAPGDRTFAERFQKDLGDWLKQGEEGAKTKAGRQTYQALAANLEREFAQKAMAGQAEMAGQHATNQVNAALAASSRKVALNPADYPAEKARLAALVHDPSSSFGDIPSVVREHFDADARSRLAFSAASAFTKTENGARVILDSLAPEVRAQVDPSKILLQNRVATGAATRFTPTTQADAPKAIAVSAPLGISPNILLALKDAKGDSSPTFFEVEGQRMFAALEQFGGNYTKALAASDLGASEVKNLEQRYGPLWEQQLPAQTAAFVSTVLTNAGAIPGAPMPQAEPPKELALPAQGASSLPFIADLSGEQLHSILGEAVQTLDLRERMKARERQEEERQLGKKQDALMDGYLKQIWDPKTHGAYNPKAVTEDPTLSWQQKQHLEDYRNTRIREQRAMAESKSNPLEVRKFMIRIYAPDGDPKQLYNTDEVMDSYTHGRLSTAEMLMLREHVSQLKNGSTQGFRREMNNALSVLRDSILKDPRAQAQPDIYIPLVHEYEMEAWGREQALRAEGKDPRILLDRNSPEYILKPEKLGVLLHGAKLAAKQKAEVLAAPPAPGLVDRAPATVGGVKLVAGQVYEIDGVQKTYLGGEGASPASWGPVAPKAEPMPPIMKGSRNQ